MKLLITEKQIKTLVNDVLNQEIDEQEASTPDTTNQPTQTVSDNYPSVHKWESGVTRGPGNQIGITKWSDVVGSKLSRNRYPLN